MFIEIKTIDATIAKPQRTIAQPLAESPKKIAMKKLIILLIFIFTISTNYSQESNLQEITKAELINFIKKAKKDGKIANNPLVVIDEEIILDIDGLNNNQKFYGEISIVEKGNKEMIQIYGNGAINGIIMIKSTSENPQDQGIEISDGLVIFFIGNKEVTEKDLQKLNPDSILNVQVIKSKKEIEKYTDKICDGIVIINLNKKK